MGKYAILEKDSSKNLIKEKYIELKNTSNTGLGIFSKKDFKKGDFVFKMQGEIKKRFYKNRHEASAEPNMLGIGKNIWIDPIGSARFINHSCNPNLGIKGRIKFVAIKDIKKGDELTFDYSISEESDWEMLCKCGNDKCRKIIKSIKYLPKEDFERLKEYVPKYFQKIYLRYNK